jgi:DNA polymerase III epsilon subunit-like protein
MNTSSKVYYSLDIETSGFDPERCEILEVGLVGFTFDTPTTPSRFAGHPSLKRRGFKVVEEWARVFKPQKPVSHHVLGLTGIKQKELDKGENFEDHRKFLQDKLGKATVLGHNVVFDIKFLEKFGIKFSGLVLDTLDLAQFILPTHHSYNLENLMHLFAVPHKEAHRALADSRATVKLLEKLLGTYNGLPKETKVAVEKLAKKINAPWLPLLKANIAPVGSTSKTLSISRPKIQVQAAFDLKDQVIYTVPPFAEWQEVLDQLISHTNEPLLLVLPKQHDVLSLWKTGLARGIFLPRFTVSSQKLKAFLAKEFLTPEEARFLMKVLVWQAGNWQKECILDMNLSFFGGQFKDQVCGQEFPKDFSERVLCCDQQTFLELKTNGFTRGRTVAIAGLGEFERNITATIGQKNSLGYVNYLLKTVYDPQTNLGRADAKAPVTKALADVDLFFGLAGALLLKLNSGYGNVVIDANILNSFEHQKIRQAAEHFCQKLLEAGKELGLLELENFSGQLRSFFLEREGYVKWIEISETKCVFFNLPLDIAPLVKKALAGCEKVCFLESLRHPLVLDYFSNRLGLQKLTVDALPIVVKKNFTGKISGAVKSIAGKKSSPGVIMGALPEPEGLEKLLTGRSVPAALIMETPVQVSGFYQKYYLSLGKKIFLAAQSQSGGVNKLFRNFSIRKNSLLIITEQAVLRFLRGSQQQVKPAEHLPVKTLFFNYSVKDSAKDPYEQALSGKFSDPEKEYFLPIRLYNFQNLARFFRTKTLSKIYIFFPKKPFKYKEIIVEYVNGLFNQTK